MPPSALIFFFELGADLGADIDERAPVAIHPDGGRGRDGLALRVAAPVVNRGQHLSIDLLLRDRARVANAPIGRRAPLRTGGRHYYRGGGHEAKQRESG